MLRPLVWIAPALLLTTGGNDPVAPAPDDRGPRGFPLQFDSEVVRLFVEDDSLRVEGLYRFLCRRHGAPTITLLYPYPADSLLGDARTELLEGREPEGTWEPLTFGELPQQSGVRWAIPMNRGDLFEVRTVYRQALRARYARYIVTSTSAWDRPLRNARFEIHLPEGAVPTRFSFPFERRDSNGGVFYSYEANDFLPDRDVVVEWTFPEGLSR